jgi:hypothetical protein
MRKKQKSNKSRGGRRWQLVLVLVAVYAISSVVSYIFLKDKFAFESPFITEIESRQALNEQKKTKGEPGRLYESTAGVPAVKSGSVPRKSRMLVLAEDTIRKLVKKYDVRLLDLYLDRDGIIYIDFSAEMKKDHNLDISQELEFLSSLFKGIRVDVPGLVAMKILIEDREVESLGGHIDISKPIGEEIAGIF